MGAFGFVDGAYKKSQVEVSDGRLAKRNEIWRTELKVKSEVSWCTGGGRILLGIEGRLITAVG